MKLRRVVVSGVGVVSAAGIGLEALGAAIAKGATLARPARLLDASGFPNGMVCEVDGLDARALARSPKEAKVLSRASVLALGALADLVAKVPAPFVDDPWKAGLFLGVGLEQGDHRDLLATASASRGSGARIALGKLATEGVAAMNPLSALKTLPNMALAHIAMKLGDAAPRGPNAAYSPWDASALEAVAAATEAIHRGECDVALAGGADAMVSVFGLTTLHRLLLSRDGVPPGEGAALFLLETAERASAAGRPALATIEGLGSASDAAPPGVPNEAGALQAIQAALAWGAIKPGTIDVGVGSGVASGAFARAMRGARKAPQAASPFSDVRPILGECGAATGAMSLAAALTLVGQGRGVVASGGVGGAYAALVLRGGRA